MRRYAPRYTGHLGPRTIKRSNFQDEVCPPLGSERVTAHNIEKFSFVIDYMVNHETMLSEIFCKIKG